MNIKNILKVGGIGVFLTDTIYGVVGQALNKEAVSRIYKIKKRNPKKPFIILISSIEDLERFGIKPTKFLSEKLKRFWPGKVSIILDLPKHKTREFAYLHRGTRALAFRLPKAARLRNLIAFTGPLVAPSANPEGLPPAENIRAAKKYFGKNVDFYSGKGNPDSTPSILVKIRKEKIEILRATATQRARLLKNS